MATSVADFEKLYNEHYAEIRRFIFTIARRDQNITEDISLNVWENVYRYIGSLRDIASARAWLYAIARNEAKRYFANKHIVFFAEALPLDEGEAVSVIDERDSAFPEALADADMLSKLIGRLSEDEQRIIILHCAYGIGLKEIAEMDGTNYNTLKSNYRRAMEKLRKAATTPETEI